MLIYNLGKDREHERAHLVQNVSDNVLLLDVSEVKPEQCAGFIVFHIPRRSSVQG